MSTIPDAERGSKGSWQTSQVISPTGITGAGRFAPSPTGELHLGNLRTALVAWMSARAQSLRFIVRMEDLDRVTSSPVHESAQLRALELLGLDWDAAVVRQSDRFALYDAAIGQLVEQGRTYDCYCTRREIREASSAPQGARTAEGVYPGTCRTLSRRQRADFVAQGRQPALRLDAGNATVVIEIVDDIVGPYAAAIDDVVLRRNDRVPAYNLAVVVDDAAQGVAEVVRGDDLLSSTPRQVMLQRLLARPTPRYRHIPMVLGADGVRLAKRHGATTLTQLTALGAEPPQVLTILAVSLGLAEIGERVTPQLLVSRFELAALPSEPWVLPLNLQRSVT